MFARNEERLKQFEQEIRGTTEYVCDVSNEAEVNATVAAVTEQLGPPSVLINNAVSFDSIFGTFLEIDPKGLEQNFQVNTMGLLYMARAVVPQMLEAGRGAIMVTANTASWRGKPQFAAFAPNKTAQPILAQSMARTLGHRECMCLSSLSVEALICRSRANCWTTNRTTFFQDLAHCRHDLERRPSGPFRLDV